MGNSFVPNMFCKASLLLLVVIVLSSESAGGVRELQQAPVGLEALNDGEVRMLISHDGDTSTRIRYVQRPEDGSMFRLNLPDTVDEGTRGQLITGTRVNLRGRSGRNRGGSHNEFNASSVAITHVPNPRGDVPPGVTPGKGRRLSQTSRTLLGGTAPAVMNVVFIRLDFGGLGASISNNDTEGYVFYPSTTNKTQTVQQHFESCSYGLTKLDRTRSFVAGPITIPFSGTFNNITYNYQSCGWDDLVGMANAADSLFDAWAIANKKFYPNTADPVRIANFTYRAYILGKNSGCDNPAAPAPWSAIAEGGCGTFCRTWYRPGPANNPYMYIHELGHNLFMHHSSKGGLEYNDASCPLGVPAQRCYNAPHSWQLGWMGLNVPVLNASNLAAGTSQSFVLPAAHTNQTNMVAITADWSGLDPVPRYWIQYRKPFKNGGFFGDSDLQAGYADQVSVYRYNGTRYASFQLTEHLKTLSAATTNNVWSDATSTVKLSVTVTKLLGNTAYVTVTRLV